MLEAAVGMAHGQHRASGLLYHALGYAPEKHVSEPGAAVSSKHDKVGVLGLRGVDDLEKRGADTQQAPRLDLRVAQLGDNLVELALCPQPLLLGDLIHRAYVEGRA